MSDGIQSIRSGVAGALGATRPQTGRPLGDDFASALKQQLEAVSRMQSEADQNVQRLVTGETQNLTEVFTATRKAQVAFSLMMEIRNKLVDAYQELQNLRV